MSNSSSVSSIAVDKNEEIKTLSNEKDPFKIIDDEGSYVEQQHIFDQPPTTKWELWSYYLYYNGVRCDLLQCYLKLIWLPNILTFLCLGQWLHYV